ncbi:hypothetical protein PoB_005817600 [Plakobranchus ocellatus]|uniref:Uncharacterized protein n=1 Tax=Plakobranchus ocellatus TaxID=259542 RepID=A0AAV4CFV4_9GAST|nr:hypothetical protein PoB_005817600 [Plakobranchus ocellatus]
MEQLEDDKDRDKEEKRVQGGGKWRVRATSRKTIKRDVYEDKQGVKKEEEEKEEEEEEEKEKERGEQAVAKKIFSHKRKKN